MIISENDRDHFRSSFRPCLQMKWDKDGDTLAAITEKSNLVYLWSANTQRATTIDTPPKYQLIFFFENSHLISGIIPLFSLGQKHRPI